MLLSVCVVSSVCVASVCCVVCGCCCCCFVCVFVGVADGVVVLCVFVAAVCV